MGPSNYRSGVTIVPMAGYDSVPSDLTNYLMWKQIENAGKICVSVQNFCKPNAGISGGTVASVLGIFSLGSRKLKTLRNPSYLVSPEHAKPNLNRLKNTSFVSYEPAIKSWTSMYLMGAADQHVVLRSNSLYGKDIPYMEAQPHSSFLSAFGTAVLFSFLIMLMLIPFTKNLLKKFAPQPGTGPQHRSKNCYTFTTVGKLDSQNEKFVSKFVGSDPYEDTAKFVCETALCLVLERDNISIGGVLTPSFCMGDALIKRLENIGFVFKFD
eukprot:TRINITY_DN4755_c0_g1_i1.p1 TRINITY_DN4755_c0_g1~~TRINITY_DN4755_c0_g1_i1.p1  ORF type:complete len:268 (+),score=34.74 TRINITY_DN4755_c0_g1_i1:344-1147(+)